MHAWRLAANMIAGVCLALMFAACGSSSTASEAPGSPSVSAAATAPPTASPSSMLPAARTLASVDGALERALAATHGATSYRVALDITTRASAGETTSSDVFLSMQGVVLGATSHVTYSKGSINDLLGGGDRIEVINVGQRTYLRGSSLFGGSDPAAWYALPDSEMTHIPFDAWYLLSLAGIDGRSARATDAEMRDGMPCTVWSASFPTNALKLLELSAPQGATTDFSAIDQADARALVCPDGYLHAVDLDASAHIPDRPADRFWTAVRLRLFDFNARTLSVAAPSGAIEVK